jgi:hypothetical protein
MAFTIENFSKLPFIHVRMLKPVERTEVRLLQSQLREALGQRRKHTCVYVGINLSGTMSQEKLPLIPIISQFAHFYHESRGQYQVELLLAIDPTLMPGVRYVAESLVVPMLFFASDEALLTYVLRRNTDTQPISPDVVREALTNIVIS